MTDQLNTAWEDITGRLEELSDKQLGNLVLVIQETLAERGGKCVKPEEVCP